MNASEIMTKNCKTIRDTASMKEAVNIMLEGHIGGLPVLDAEGKVLGMISEADFVGRNVKIPHGIRAIPEIFNRWFHDTSIEEIFKWASDKTVGELMTYDPLQCIPPDMSVTRVVKHMLDRDIKRLMVCENQKLLGVITQHDILKTFNSKR